MVGAFMAQRFGRVYPAYFVASCIYYVKWLVNLTGHRLIEFHAYDVVANLLLIQGWDIGAEGICPVAWSVSGEMFAYFLFPVLVCFITAKGGWRSALLVAAAMIGIVFVALSPYGVSGSLDVVDSNTFLPLLRGVSEFSLGLVAFELSRKDICKRILSGAWAVPVILGVIVGVFWLGLPDVAFVLAIPFLVIGLSYDGRAASLLLGNRVVHKLGVISYSLYLLHPALRNVAGRLMEITSARYGVSPHTPFIVLAIVAAVAAAYVSQRLVEVPGRHLVNRLAGRFFPAPLSTGHALQSRAS
jgi:peptidoglycan/LPS O-acetylase OafA/YrhL